MTTSPDTIHAAEATTGAEATTADRASSVSAGTIGGTVSRTARTQARPPRPDMDDEQMSSAHWSSLQRSTRPRSLRPLPR